MQSALDVRVKNQNGTMMCHWPGWLKKNATEVESGQKCTHQVQLNYPWQVNITVESEIVQTTTTTTSTMTSSRASTTGTSTTSTTGTSTASTMGTSTASSTKIYTTSRRRRSTESSTRNITTSNASTSTGPNTTSELALCHVKPHSRLGIIGKFNLRRASSGRELREGGTCANQLALRK